MFACKDSQTKDGLEIQFGVNHVAHFLLFQLLAPTLLASSTPAFNSRVVSLSSAAHRFGPLQLDDLDWKQRGYNEWLAYGQAKTANIYFASELDRRYGSKGLHGLAVHPGGIQTELTRHMPEGESAKIFANPDFSRVVKSVAQGAATSVWAAVAKELEGRGGRYLEDCSESLPFPVGGVAFSAEPGYAAHAYDEAQEKALWKASNKLVGLPEDQ